MLGTWVSTCRRMKPDSCSLPFHTKQPKRIKYLHLRSQALKLGNKETVQYCWWDCKLVQPLWKSVWQFLKKLDIVLPEDPAIPILGMYPEDAPCNKDTCSTMFIASLFMITRSWKVPRCPSAEEWIWKMWYIYTMECYSAIKKQ